MSSRILLIGSTYGLTYGSKIDPQTKEYYPPTYWKHYECADRFAQKLFMVTHISSLKMYPIPTLYKKCAVCDKPLEK